MTYMKMDFLERKYRLAGIQLVTHINWTTEATVFQLLGMLTIVMKTKTFTVLANQRALLLSRNEKESKKQIEKKKQKHPLFNEGHISQNLFCFHHNFCLRNGTELDNDLNYR